MVEIIGATIKVVMQLQQVSQEGRWVWLPQKLLKGPLVAVIVETIVSQPREAYPAWLHRLSVSRSRCCTTRTVMLPFEDYPRQKQLQNVKHEKRDAALKSEQVDAEEIAPAHLVARRAVETVSDGTNSRSGSKLRP